MNRLQRFFRYRLVPFWDRIWHSQLPNWVQRINVLIPLALAGISTWLAILTYNSQTKIEGMEELLKKQSALNSKLDQNIVELRGIQQTQTNQLSELKGISQSSLNTISSLRQIQGESNKQNSILLTNTAPKIDYLGNVVFNRIDDTTFTLLFEVKNFGVHDAIDITNIFYGMEISAKPRFLFKTNNSNRHTLAGGGTIGLRETLYATPPEGYTKLVDEHFKYFYGKVILSYKDKLSKKPLSTVLYLHFTVKDLSKMFIDYATTEEEKIIDAFTKGR